MIELTPHRSGIILPVRAHAGARRTGLTGEQAGMLKVSVTAAPEKGKANAAIVETLCRELDLRASQVALVAGETSPQKRFLVRDVDVEELQRRLAASLERCKKR